MLGGFTGFKDTTGTDWGERMLNSVASQTIRHLFTQSESVEVMVRCQPSSKLLQGSIDSFKMNGRGLVIRRQFRAEELSFETDAVAIDFGSVLGGKIALKQPTQAVAQVVLLEPDINQAFSADLVRKRLENLSVPALMEISGGKPVSFTEIQLQLMPHNRVKILGKADIDQGELVPIALSATVGVERRRRITYKDYVFEADMVSESQRELSHRLTDAFMQILNEMVDLDRFDLDGVTMRLNRLETQGKKLIFAGYAQIERVPKNP